MRVHNDAAIRGFWSAYLLLAIRDMDDWMHGAAATDFVMSDDPRVLGFVWTCTQLGINAGALRSKCMTERTRALIRHGNRGGKGLKNAA